MTSLTWHLMLGVVCFCLWLLVQGSGSVLATNEVNVLPSYVKTSTGTSFTLDCAQPENTSVVWYQDNKRLETTTSQLTISDVTVAQSGTYRCCLKECTTGNFDSAVVDIGEGPRQLLNLSCACHNLIDINCTWSISDEGDINSNISFQILDYEIEKNMWGDLTICKFSNSSPHDKDQYCYFNLLENGHMHQAYNYRVQSANEYGELYSDNVHFHKSMQAVPHPPDKVTMNGVSSSMLNISWCKPPGWPRTQTQFLLFKVEYKVEGAVSWRDGASKSFAHNEFDCTSMRIKALEPYTSYCARVKARKSNNYDNWSKPSTMVCTTTIESTPGPPFDVRYKILPSATDEKETRTAVISWKPTPKEERNGIIVGYRIVLQGLHGDDHSNKTILEFNVTGDATNVTVPGLDNYRQYTITVQAFNSAGISHHAGPDGPIPVSEGSSVPKFLIYLLIPISVICMLFFTYCIWHWGKKILKPTYDIQIPERARNDNLYVTTVNFRMQESECFDELKAPPSSDLHVDLPPNGTCSYGNGTCPTSDYSEDPCTPGVASSENFSLSGHHLEVNGNAAMNQENKMLMVDCGEGKALLDGHPYADVIGYNHTGSPLSVASGGSYWTTSEENESISYHRMSPKGLALYEGDADEAGAAGGEPTTPDPPSCHMDYSMMGRSDRPLADHAHTTKAPSTEKENFVSSPTSPTSPVALYSVQASAFDPTADEDSVASDDDGNDISSYVRQMTSNSLGLLVPVPQVKSASDGKWQTDSEKEKTETNRSDEQNSLPAAKFDDTENKDNDVVSLSSEECVDDALDPYVQTGATKTPKGSQETPGTTAVDAYVRAGRDKDKDFDMKQVTPRVRSASGGALNAMRRTHSSAPEFLGDSDSAISIEDADLHYVQAGCLEEVQNSAVPPSPILPGVAIDFPSDGSEDIPTVNTLAPSDGNRSRSLSGDRQDLSDNDLSCMEYERYNDDSINYVKQAVGANGQESHPMLPYVAIDLVHVPQKSPAVSQPQQQALPGLPQPASLDSGYVSQNQAHMMGLTKDEAPRRTAEKSAYDNPEYGVLAQCPSELERKQVEERRVEMDNAEDSNPEDAVSITASIESLTGSPTNNNSPYVPH